MKIDQSFRSHKQGFSFTLYLFSISTLESVGCQYRRLNKHKQPEMGEKCKHQLAAHLVSTTTMAAAAAASKSKYQPIINLDDVKHKAGIPPLCWLKAYDYLRLVGLWGGATGSNDRFRGISLAKILPSNRFPIRKSVPEFFTQPSVELPRWHKQIFTFHFANSGLEGRMVIWIFFVYNGRCGHTHQMWLTSGWWWRWRGGVRAPTPISPFGNPKIGFLSRGQQQANHSRGLYCLHAHGKARIKCYF